MNQSLLFPVAAAASLSEMGEMEETSIMTETGAETAETAHSEGLSINPVMVGFHALNLLILLFALHFIIFKPILKLLAERSRKINEGMENADKAKKALDESTMIRKDMMKNAQVESQEIIEKGRKAGEEIKATIVQDAHKEATAIAEKAQKLAELEKVKAMKEFQDMSAQIILKATEKLLHKKLNPEEDTKLIQENLSHYFS